LGYVLILPLWIRVIGVLTGRLLGFSGLTLAAVLLMRTAAQALHGETVHADEDELSPMERREVASSDN
jgi:hypothetical protein